MELRWQVEERALALDGWRARLVPDGAGGAWLGGSRAEEISRGLLWHLGEGGARPVPLPEAAARAYVLDVDDGGGLWVVAYDPADASVGRGLTVLHLPPGQISPRISATEPDTAAAPAWEREAVPFGLWPQAMAMRGPERGWIGGNHARLLERTPEGWRPAEIERLPGVAAADLNVLDMSLAPSGSASHAQGVLVGSRGLVAQLSGGVWRQVPVPAALQGRHLFAVDYGPDGSVWMVSSGGNIARWMPPTGARDESGAPSYESAATSSEGAWTVERPTTFALMGIDLLHEAAPGEPAGWAVGAAGTVLALWEDEAGAAAWRPAPSPTAGDLYTVLAEDGLGKGEGAGSGSDIGWIAGQGLLLALRGEATSAGPRLLERTPAPLAARPGQGLTAADADGDGLLDIFLAGEGDARLFLRRPGSAGGFPSAFEAGAVLPRPASPYTGRREGWAVGDSDGDGRPDVLFLGEHGADRHLWRAAGDGTYRDATAEAGLGAFPGKDSSAYWVDLDTDGDLDLYLARGSSAGAAPLEDRLHENDGRGRFRSRRTGTGAATVERTVLWGDLDGDGDPDAVIPGYYPRETRLYFSDGGRLRDATAESGLSVGTPRVEAGAVADLDGDGDLDLALLGERLEIHANDGRGRFRRESSVPSGVPGGLPVFCRAGDLDHDGLPELLVHWRGVGAAATRLLARGADGSYREVGGDVGRGEEPEGDGPLANLGPLDDAVLADLDGDGDLDPLLTGPRGTVLLAGGADDERWLRVRLHGLRGTAAGASVRVREAAEARGTPSGATPGRSLALLHAAPGSGVVGEAHTGLGDVEAVDVEVIFPGTRPVLESLAASLFGGARDPEPLRIIRRGVPAGTVLDVYDTPPRLRAPVRARAAILRWWAGVDPRRAAVVAAAALLLILALGLTLRRAYLRRTRARHLGPYRLGEVLGSGGMGTVYRARDVVRARKGGRGRHGNLGETGGEVALKLLHPHLLRDETHRLRFLREARCMAAVRHPALVRVREAGEIGGRAFIAMELLEGRPLTRHLEEEGPLGAEAWRGLARALAGALAALHEGGIVHRDVKSENVFLVDGSGLAGSGADGEGRPKSDRGWEHRVRLMDLGLAWTEALATVTRRQEVVGTVATMAPERLAGRRADARSDLWSLGVVLYEAAVGRLPFTAPDGGALVRAILHDDPPPPREYTPDLPPEDEALILALLAREPTARPASARRVLEGLKEELSGGAAPYKSVYESGAPSSSKARPPRSRKATGESSRSPRVGGRTLPKPRSESSAPSDALHESDAASYETGLSGAPDDWRAAHAAALRHWEAGRWTEADVALVECLRRLRRRAAAMDDEERRAFLDRDDVAAVLDLASRLEAGASPSPVPLPPPAASSASPSSPGGPLP